MTSRSPSQPPLTPLARFDQDRRRKHHVRRLGGLDEAGRGALAGPVVAGCVVLEPGVRLEGVDDSKVLRPAKREQLVETILEGASAWALGWATAVEVDRYNVLQATLIAGGRAVADLATPPEFLLTDYLNLPDAPCPIEALVDGDARSQAIAAASILAKVARDRIMTVLDAEYPQYGFAGHKGYGTRKHLEALETHGPSTLHRLTFKGVRSDPFFGTEPDTRPKVFCASRSKINKSSAPAPIDWLRVLTEPPESLDPTAFLPEIEWENEG